MSNVPKLRFREFTDELTKAKMGALFSKGKEKGFAGLPIYSVTVDRGLVPRDSLDRHMANDADDHLNQVVDVGDLAYNTMRMWQGAAGIAEEKCMVSPAYVVARPKSGVASKLFYYWFDNARMRYLLWAYSYGLTSDRLRLYFDDFAKIPVSIPKYSEQQKIADFLTSVDTKIEQLTRKEELLKQYKKGVMQKIFSQEIRFKADDGSEFPEWEEQTLGNICTNITNGLSLDQNGNQTGFKVTRIETISSAVVNPEKVGYVETSTDISGYRLEVGDMLFSNINSVAHIGKIAYLDQDYDLYHGMNLLRLTVAPSYDAKFIYFVLTSKKYKQYFERICNKAVNQASINQTDLRRTKLTLPNRAEQGKIQEFLTMLDHKLEQLHKQILQAKTFKQGLLQQMFV